MSFEARTGQISRLVSGAAERKCQRLRAISVRSASPDAIQPIFMSTATWPASSPTSLKAVAVVGGAVTLHGITNKRWQTAHTILVVLAVAASLGRSSATGRPVDAAARRSFYASSNSGTHLTRREST